jgi:hypothetical protein
LNDRGVIAAREGGHYNPPARSGDNAAHPSTAAHPSELPAVTCPTTSSTGNQNTDKKYQQQQEKLISKQEQERQKL